jgi:hypothetical protein
MIPKIVRSMENRFKPPPEPDRLTGGVLPVKGRPCDEPDANRLRDPVDRK